ncbi:hypothetical protein Ae717Ps2_5911c [Pseudonocardia sp. Ae717_Ps2]|nr:hypothetical protein Ae717Ps2_5911c [Pseudonocardia sp. Ae717_Ps2]
MGSAPLWEQPDGMSPDAPQTTSQVDQHYDTYSAMKMQADAAP